MTGRCCRQGSGGCSRRWRRTRTRPLGAVQPGRQDRGGGIVLVGLLLTLDPLTPALLLAARAAAVVPPTGVSVARAGPAVPGRCSSARPASPSTNLDRRRRRRGAVVDSGRSTSPRTAWTPRSAVSLRAARDRAARCPGARDHRPDGPRRRPGAALARCRPGSPTARWPRCGCCRCCRPTGRRSPGPGGPAASTPAGPRWRTCGRSRRRCSRCWWPRYAGECASRPRWRPAGSARPAYRAPSPATAAAAGPRLVAARRDGGGRPRRHGGVGRRRRLAPRRSPDRESAKRSRNRSTHAYRAEFSAVDHQRSRSVSCGVTRVDGGGRPPRRGSRRGPRQQPGRGPADHAGGTSGSSGRPRRSGRSSAGSVAAAAAAITR